MPEPQDVRCLRTGERPDYEHAGRTLSIAVPDEQPTPDEVIAVSWSGTDGPTA